MMDYSQMSAPPSDNIHIGLRVTIQITECEIVAARGEGRKAFLSRCSGLLAMGDYRAVTIRNDRQLYCYTQTET